MLYEIWESVAASHPREVALIDCKTAKRWTFSELFHDGGQQTAPGEGIVCCQGSGAEFILSVLVGWRQGAVIVPLEAGQAPPKFDRGALPSACRHIKTTSATGGAPRMAMFSEEQLLADVENIATTMGLRPDCPNIAAISLAHSYGFSNLVLPLLLKGVPLILAHGAYPESLRAAVAMAERPVALAGVPALWRAWLEGGAPLDRIEIAISAGAPLPIDLEKRVHEKTALKIHNFYGSTECGGIAYDREPAPRTDGGIVGTAMSHVKLATESDGRLRVESKAVGMGYWPEPHPNFGGGVFITGDLVEMEGGCVRIMGRATDIINVAGRKLNPEVVEEALRKQPSVENCLVFGISDVQSQRGEIVVAVIQSSAPVSPEELRRSLAVSLSEWQMPREWWFVDHLPVNQRGKLSRAEWRERYIRFRMT